MHLKETLNASELQCERFIKLALPHSVIWGDSGVWGPSDHGKCFFTHRLHDIQLKLCHITIMAVAQSGCPGCWFHMGATWTIL